MQRKIIGIYCIENLVNNKRYIGKSIDILCRFKGHKRELRNNRHFNEYLQRSYNKYGLENFDFYILEECSIELLKDREIHYIEKSGSKKLENGYNLTDGGEGTLGFPCSEERKSKISRANKGRERSEDSKKRISESAKKRIHTPEENKKISEATRGRQRGFNKKSNKTSPYLGVCKRKHRKKFTVQITYGQRTFRLGNYASEIDAAKAYDFVAFFMYGENAILNFPEDYK